MATALFITRNDIIKNTPLQGAIDADALLPFMVTAQIKYIKNLIGTVLYDFLSLKIETGTVGDLSIYYQDLLADHIKPTLIWYACVEYIPFSSGISKPFTDLCVKDVKSFIIASVFACISTTSSTP